MSGGPSIYQQITGIGDAFSKSYEGARKEKLASDLGAKIKAGDLTGAADIAFQGGDVQTGLALFKLGDSRAADKRFEQGLGNYLGGGSGDAPAAGTFGALTAQRGASGSVAAFKTDDPVAEGLTAQQKALLNGIAGPESAGKYNIRFTPRGGALFEGFTRHPGIAEMGPEGPSTAAGRYQFTKTTWDGMGGGDFSPANQDRRALQLAAQDYRSRTGRDLDADLQAEGFSPRIQKALAPTWRGLAGNQDRNAATYSESLARYQGAPAAAPSAPAPTRVAGLNPDAANRPDEGAQPAQASMPPGSTGDARGAPATPTVNLPVSVQLAGAGVPRQDAVAIGQQPPGSPGRINGLISLSLIPGLSEQRQGVVKTLLNHELDRSKEGGQIRAQIQAREAEVIRRGLDPRDPRNQRYIFTGSMPEEKTRSQIIKGEDGGQYVVDPENAATLANPTRVNLPPSGPRIWGQTGPDGQIVQPPPGIQAGTAGYYDAKGEPQLISGKGVSVTNNVDTKGAGKFAEKANEHQAKRYGEILDAADQSVRLRGDVETLAELGAQIATGKGAQTRLTLAQYAQAVGLDSVAQGLTGGKLGEMEAFGAIADRLTPQMRVPGSGATSDMEMRTFRNAIPSLLKTPEGNKIVADTFRGLLDYQGAAGEIAGKALRGEMGQADADQAIRGLPSPFDNFKGYQRARKGASADQVETATPKPSRPRFGSVPVPMDAVRDLRGLPDTPENRGHFDDIFGEGASARVLGKAKP